jgi:hypothetical protein
LARKLLDAAGESLADQEGRGAMAAAGMATNQWPWLGPRTGCISSHGASASTISTPIAMSSP